MDNRSWIAFGACLSVILLGGFKQQVSECSDPAVVQNYKSQVTSIMAAEDVINQASLENALKVTVTGQDGDRQHLHFTCMAELTLGARSNAVHYLLNLEADRKSFKVITFRKFPMSPTILDCQNPRHPNDRLICVSPQLLQKDINLGRLYERDREKAVANHGNVEMIDLYPSEWRDARRICGSDPACTNSFYDDHTATLRLAVGDTSFWQYLGRTTNLDRPTLLLYLVVGAWVLVSCYFIPFIIAIARRRPKRMRVFLVNLLVGWTVIGWLVAFVMALRTPSLESQ